VKEPKEGYFMVSDFFGKHSCVKEVTITGLEKDIQYVKDTCILLRDELELKEKENGDRDKQITEARERLRAIDDITDEIAEEAESFRKILLDTRDALLKLENLHDLNKGNVLLPRNRLFTILGWIVAFVSAILLAILKF
jgi:hypothetical protein